MKLQDTWISLLCISVLICFGCQNKSGEKSAGKPASITVSESAKLLLVKADKADGKEDRKIEKCYSCALGMDGNPEIVADVSGYQAHFCSEGCREKFVKDAESKIASTEVPNQN